MRDPQKHLLERATDTTEANSCKRTLAYHILFLWQV